MGHPSIESCAWGAPSHVDFLAPGVVIAGRYKVRSSLGSGGSAAVYLVWDTLCECQRALKMLAPSSITDKRKLTRFMREIALAQRVVHPHVLTCYEWLLEGEMFCYTMEYASGKTLADHLAQKGTFSIAQVEDYLSQICAGLGALHREGIIHRDLKPSNLIFGADGLLKITDFGIARYGSSAVVTSSGGIVGSIDYIAPETWLHSAYEKSADMYAVGVIAFEMLTGHAPHQRLSAMDSIQAKVQAASPSPRDERRDCPRQLAAVVLRLLERSPTKRIQDTGELSAALKGAKTLTSVRKEVSQRSMPHRGPGGGVAAAMQAVGRLFSAGALSLHLIVACLLLITLFLIGQAYQVPDTAPLKYINGDVQRSTDFTP